MTTEQIVDILTDLGLRPEADENGAYGFMYENLRYIYFPSDDENFLQISLAPIHRLDDDDDRNRFLHLCNEVTKSIKYVKMQLLDSVVWPAVELRIYSEDGLDAAIVTAIRALQSSKYSFDQMLEKEHQPDEDSDEEPEETIDGDDKDFDTMIAEFIASLNEKTDDDPESTDSADSADSADSIDSNDAIDSIDSNDSADSPGSDDAPSPEEDPENQ